MAAAAAEELSGGASDVDEAEAEVEEPGFADPDELLHAASTPVAAAAASVKQTPRKPPRPG
jgi:hypothetical protein